MPATANPIETLCRYAAVNLPDSISERKAVLLALSKVLKPHHPVYREVQASLAVIQTLEKLQNQLPIHFIEP
jgi:hypothetical protein